MPELHLKGKRGVLMKPRPWSLVKSCDIAIVYRHGNTQGRGEMPVHHVQGPPQISAPSYGFGTELLLGKLSMEAFQLGYAYCLR